MAQDHLITWGEITLSEPTSTPTAAGAVIEAQGEGASFGNPVPLVEVIQSQLTDGSLAVVQGYDNREVTLRLRLSAAAGVSAGPALAAAEAALFTYCRAKTVDIPPLKWTPIADNSALTVYDVVTATLERDDSDGWDIWEKNQGCRYFKITLTCGPFPRADELTVLPALAPNPPSPTTSLKDNGTSLTNWSVESAGYGSVLRTNLVRNPSPRVNTSTWTPGSNDELVRVTGGYLDAGGYAFRVRGDSSSQTLAEASTWIGNVTAGDTIAEQVRVKTSAASFVGEDITARLRWMSGNNGLGDVVDSDVGSAVIASTSYQLATVIGTAPVGAKSARMVVVGERASAGTVSVDFDAAFAEESASIGTYFDGETADAGGNGCDWLITASNSQSVQYVIPTASIVSGAVTVEAPRFRFNDGLENIILKRTAAVSMGGLPYLRVTAVTASGYHYDRFLFDGLEAIPIHSEPSAEDGFTDYYLQVGDFNEFRLDNSRYPELDYVKVSNIEATDTLPQVPRERSRQTTVGGSAPTQAAVSLSDDTTGALGIDSLIYSTGSAFAPNLRRQWHVSGDVVTPSSGSFSGSVDNVTDVNSSVYRVPVSSLERGLYSLVIAARENFEANPTPTISWSVKLTDSAGANVVGSEAILSGSKTTEIPAGGINWIVPLDNLHLPPVDAVDTDRYVEITFTATSGSPYYLDEVWLFNLDNGSLTWVEDPSETLRFIEIRSPELGAPRASVWGSTSGDGSNAVNIDRLCRRSFGTHRFNPGTTQIFTATSTSQESKSEIKFYKRYHSHVGDE